MIFVAATLFTIACIVAFVAACIADAGVGAWCADLIEGHR